MAFFARVLKWGFGVEKNEELSNIWAQKALCSNDSFAIGYCYFNALGVQQSYDKAYGHFIGSLQERNEFGQYMVGICFNQGFGTIQDKENALYWFVKFYSKMQRINPQIFERYQLSGTQGLACAQYAAGFWFEDIKFPIKEQALYWIHKAANQRYTFALENLEEIDLYFPKTDLE